MARTILISGVSSGLGAALAESFVEQGDLVLGLSRREPTHHGVKWRATDISDPKDVMAAIDQLLPDSSRLDVVICNAGVGLIGSIEETSLEAARCVFDVNYFGVVHVLQAVLHKLRKQRSGKILIVGSLAGSVPLPFQAHYAASKAAIESFSFALRTEVSPWGVSVILVEPGDIRTSFDQAMLRQCSEKSPYDIALYKCSTVVAADMKVAPSENVVVNLVERILRMPNPRPRYSVGPSSWLVSVARRVFTDRINLRLIRNHFRI